MENLRNPKLHRPLELKGNQDFLKLINFGRMKLNNWKTSTGNTAKNVETWKKIDGLTQNKYIEVVWIKGHSGHFENTLCDLYAREAAEKS